MDTWQSNQVEGNIHISSMHKLQAAEQLSSVGSQNEFINIAKHIYDLLDCTIQKFVL